MTASTDSADKSYWPLLDYGFRCFFLAAGLFAGIAVFAWLSLLHGATWPGAPLNPLFWHIHEMLFGFVMAAMAGFLLTAVPNWTGQPPLRGAGLAGLLSAWLAGRLLMACGSALSPWLVAAVDLLFPVLLTVIIMRCLIIAGNRRNYMLGVLIALFPISNGVFHLGELGILDTAQTIIYLVPHLIVLLVAIIGGRIIPSFTANWLRLQGRTGQLPLTLPWLERSTLLLTIVTGIWFWLWWPTPTWGGALLAFATMLAHASRLFYWRGWQTWSNPLLAILHIAYGWLVAGYLLLGLSALSTSVSHSSALHAITIGAIGTMILAVMSRVALGHTGRPLQAARLTVIAYVLVSIAALSRIIAASTDSYSVWIDLSGMAWSIAFVAFVWVYWPILTRSS
jgi:uncharacterized protein involved in response to NO